VPQARLEMKVAREVRKLAARIVPCLSYSIAAGTTVLDRHFSLALFRQRLLMLDQGLTARELDVCSRAMIGMTSEGTALDLALGKTSVLTYRRRAYARLGISSYRELFHLIAH
jgi:DNA-binding CsgD family transcriptional regulator